MSLSSAAGRQSVPGAIRSRTSRSAEQDTSWPEGLAEAVTGRAKFDLTPRKGPGGPQAQV